MSTNAWKMCIREIAPTIFGNWQQKIWIPKIPKIPEILDINFDCLVRQTHNPGIEPSSKNEKWVIFEVCLQTKRCNLSRVQNFHQINRNLIFVFFSVFFWCVLSAGSIFWCVCTHDEKCVSYGTKFTDLLYYGSGVKCLMPPKIFKTIWWKKKTIFVHLFTWTIEWTS